MIDPEVDGWAAAVVGAGKHEVGAAALREPILKRLRAAEAADIAVSLYTQTVRWYAGKGGSNSALTPGGHYGMGVEGQRRQRGSEGW